MVFEVVFLVAGAIFLLKQCYGEGTLEMGKLVSVTLSFTIHPYTWVHESRTPILYTLQFCKYQSFLYYDLKIEYIYLYRNASMCRYM